MNIDKYQDATINNGNTFLTIPINGTTAAAPFDCIGVRPFGIVTYQGFLACNLTFQSLPFSAGGLAAAPGNVTNSDLANLCDKDGTTYTVAAQANKNLIPLDPSVFCNARIINITSSVTQTTGGIIMLILQPIWQGIHS